MIVTRALMAYFPNHADVSLGDIWDDDAATVHG